MVGKNKENKVFQMLKGWALQMEMPKYRNKKTKGEK